MSRFSEHHYYATIGLSAPTWLDENLGVKVSWVLEPIQKECVLDDALKIGNQEELEEDAAEFFGDEPIFFRDEDGLLNKKFYDH